MLARPDMIENDQALMTLRAFISDGAYKPGDRLPAERELMQELGQSRAVLRKALDALEREGAIWRHVGKGTFVAGTVQNAALAGHESLPGMLEIGQRLTPVRMMRARLCIEPAIAREAAINASGETLARIGRAHGQGTPRLKLADIRK